MSAGARRPDGVSLPADRGAATNRGTPRPIFVIGSLRSGGSLLTLSLGQHPNLRLVPDTNWFARFAFGLQQAYAAGISPRATSHLDIVGIEIEDYFAQFGAVIDQMMVRTRLDLTAQPVRWLDGSQSNSANVFPLARLFPHATFIHVLRDASEVVESLSSPDNAQVYRSRHIMMSRTQATDHWLETVMACVAAERAFGSETVLRVRRRDLVGRPEQTIRRCLAFLDEPFDMACLRPLRSIVDEAAPERGTAEASDPKQRSIVPPHVSMLSDALLDDEAPRYRRDENAVVRLEMEFSRRCEAEACHSSESSAVRPHIAYRRLLRSAVGQVIRSRFVKPPRPFDRAPEPQADRPAARREEIRPTE